VHAIESLHRVAETESVRFAVLLVAVASGGNPNWDTPPTLMPVAPNSPLFEPDEHILARFEKADGLT
jgi:hypothetical protein